MCAISERVLLMVVVMWSVTAFAKNAGDSSLLVGNCDEKNENY